MRIDKLFGVLVVAGASSTVGLNGCSSSTSGGGDAGGSGTDDTGASSGSAGSGASSGSGGSGASSGSDAGMGGDSSSCVCMPDTQVATWTDCNGCCCWLAAGTPKPAGVTTAICGVEPCCAGKGR